MLPFLLQKKLPFAIWSYPEEVKWQGIAQNDHEVDSLDLNDIGNAEGFIVAPFESTDSVSIIRPDIEFDSENFSLEAELEENIHDFQIETVIENLDIIVERSYIESCKNLIESIQNGKAEKVVLSRVKSIPFDTKKLLRFFMALIEKYQNAMIFMYSTGNGVWIGASPEVIIEVNDNRFKTMALAGSKPVNDASEWGTKELKEQDYVSRYIQEKLKNAEVLYTQSDLTTINAGPVAHLQTNFTGEIESHQLCEIIKQLHPTPAVCGIPNKKALELIKEFESHWRSDYTGYFGPVRGGDVSLFVNLRSALLTDQEMYLFLGGGITADSIPEKEWEETELKAETLLDCYKNC